ncbi:MAG: GIY-YIG nuclease family protein [Hyphomicrobiales bacterium]
MNRGKRMEEKHPAVYILANRPKGVVYVGVTSALWNRVATHKDGGVKGFTAKYNVKMLVWYEHHPTMNAAIRREKQIKDWKRSWKNELIEKMNPGWVDLHDRIDPLGTLVELVNDKDSGLGRNDGVGGV